MSLNPEVDQFVALEPHSDGVEHFPSDRQTEPAPVPTLVEAAQIMAPAGETAAAPAETRTEYGGSVHARTRPKWMILTALAAVGLIASGVLGYFLYSTGSRLDATRYQLSLTQANLENTKLQLTSLQADAASKKVTADYLSRYIADSGKVHTDYEQIVACQNYSACRTASQQDLTDMQAFQSDRQSANVPAALNNSDGELGDSLSAGIAAVQVMIDGMDNNSQTKFSDGFTKLEAAMLNMAKAEAALGVELR